MYQLGQACLFDLSYGSQASAYGNVYGGINGGGRCYLVVGNQTFTTTVAPPTSQWCHYGWQLHGPVAPGNISTVNFLFNGAVYPTEILTATLSGNVPNGWAPNLNVGQHVNGDYGWVGRISNFRLSTEAVYVTPYTFQPRSYSMVFPLSATSSTAVLLQGKPLKNVASPSQSITFLSQFPYPLVSELVSNLPTYGSVEFALHNSTLSKSSSFNFNEMSGVDWTFDIYTNITMYQSGGFGSFVVDLRPYQTDTGGALSFILMSGKWGIWGGTNDTAIFNSIMPLGVWSHSAIMRKSNQLYLFINGVPSGNISSLPASGFMDNLSIATGLTIGAPAQPTTFWTGGSYKFAGFLAQPMIRLGAQYPTTGFTPSPSLAPLAAAAGANTLLFVDAVGASNTPTEMVTNIALDSTETTSTAIRYMPY